MFATFEHETTYKHYFTLGKHFLKISKHVCSLKMNTKQLTNITCAQLLNTTIGCKKLQSCLFVKRKQYTWYLKCEISKNF